MHKRSLTSFIRRINFYFILNGNICNRIPTFSRKEEAFSNFIELKLQEHISSDLLDSTNQLISRQNNVSKSVSGESNMYRIQVKHNFFFCVSRAFAVNASYSLILAQHILLHEVSRWKLNFNDCISTAGRYVSGYPSEKKNEKTEMSAKTLTCTYNHCK